MKKYCNIGRFGFQKFFRRLNAFYFVFIKFNNLKNLNFKYTEETEELLTSFYGLIILKSILSRDLDLRKKNFDLKDI
ncbi:hypothetical protein BpHYR1_018405 [Brachionus plicatilis]|uniref:Uncharacterized protein n=1 Tax=Brachionus plicatilis TaxID=10195 RepID=A0A3M7P6P4_BRAPC|nr:hypothetical protein BpHYR1_018405 [Brachionus plicatilis]